MLLRIPWWYLFHKFRLLDPFLILLEVLIDKVPYCLFFLAILQYCNTIICDIIFLLIFLLAINLVLSFVNESVLVAESFNQVHSNEENTSFLWIVLLLVNWMHLHVNRYPFCEVANDLANVTFLIVKGTEF